MAGCAARNRSCARGRAEPLLPVIFQPNQGRPTVRVHGFVLRLARGVGSQKLDASFVDPLVRDDLQEMAHP